MPANTAEYMKQYLQEKNTNIKCDLCSCEFLKYNKSYHEKTQKHQKNIQKQNDNAMKKSKAIEVFVLMKKKIQEQEDKIKLLENKS